MDEQGLYRSIALYLLTGPANEGGVHRHFGKALEALAGAPGVAKAASDLAGESSVADRILAAVKRYPGETDDAVLYFLRTFLSLAAASRMRTSSSPADEQLSTAHIQQAREALLGTL